MYWKRAHGPMPTRYDTSIRRCWQWCRSTAVLCCPARPSPRGTPCPAVASRRSPYAHCRNSVWVICFLVISKGFYGVFCCRLCCLQFFIICTRNIYRSECHVLTPPALSARKPHPEFYRPPHRWPCPQRGFHRWLRSVLGQSSRHPECRRSLQVIRNPLQYHHFH